MTDPYFTTLKYRSLSDGDAAIELEVRRYSKKTEWTVRAGSEKRLGPFRNKLTAIVAASRIYFQRSADEMLWEPTP